MSYEKAIALMGKGPSRPTLFSVRLPNGFVSTETNDYIDFFCTSAVIPEVRHNTVAVAGQEYMGIVREQPTAIMFGKPFTIAVVGDSEFKVYKELREWFDRTAVNANQGAGDIQTTLNTGRSQRMRYYNTFVRDMDLIKLEFPGTQNENQNTSEREDQLLEVMKVNFINAFPISLSTINLDTSLENQATSFSVAFSYESYSLTYEGLGRTSVPRGLFG